MTTLVAAVSATLCGGCDDAGGAGGIMIYEKILDDQQFPGVLLPAHIFRRRACHDHRGMFGINDVPLICIFVCLIIGAQRVSAHRATVLQSPL